jgi:rhodanese-related sulfurtransferase
MLTGLTLRGQDTAEIEYILLDPYYFHLTYLQEEPALIVDTGEGFEFRKRRIKDAVHIPNVRSLNTALDTITPDYSVFIYCNVDSRAISAAKIFYERGFRKIYVP